MWIYELTKIFCGTFDLLVLFMYVPGRVNLVWRLECSAAFLQLKRLVILRKNGEGYENLHEI
jgi:hypothetical protein